MFLRIGLVLAVVANILPSLALADDNKVSLRGSTENADLDIEDRELTGACGTPLTCSPVLHFASNEQALCDPEDNFYAAAPGNICSVNFPSVLILAGLEVCKASIGYVKFVLTYNGGVIRSWQDKFYPYTVFSNVPGSFQAETLLPGTYSLSVVIRDPNRCVIWSGVIDFTVTSELCDTQPFCGLLTQGGGHLYRENAVSLTYEQAKCAATTFPLCCGNVAHLATITSAAENGYVATACPPPDQCYIGLTDTVVENTFTWLTGEPYGYSNWANGEPNDFAGAEDCVEINAFVPAKWNDLSCNANRPSVIEYESFCPPAP